MTGVSGPLGWSLGWQRDADHKLTAFTDANSHQTLHSVSVGLIPHEYQNHLGWEEAVVEGLQRHWRPAILARLGVPADEATFAETEVAWVYEYYLTALRQIAAEIAAVVPEPQFFLALLKTPLKDRKAHALAWGRRSPDWERFKRIYAAASGVLSL